MFPEFRRLAAVGHDVIHGLLVTAQRTQADALREIGMHAVSRTMASNQTQHLTSSIPPVCFSALVYILYGKRIAFKFSAVLSASPSVPIGSGNLSPGGARSRRERSSATSTESDIPPRLRWPTGAAALWCRRAVCVRGGLDVRGVCVVARDERKEAKTHATHCLD